MGCATSKHDHSPAVALCRERCPFLDEAVRLRFAFAEAHITYLHSLKEVALSLDRFFTPDPDAPPSLLLNLPPQRKGEKIHHHLHSRSDSGTHLHFHSDDDDGSSYMDSLHHHDGGNENLNFNIPNETGGFMNVNYMKKHTAPSVVYTQRLIIPETIYMAESSSSFYPNPNYSNNQTSYPMYTYNNGYSNYGGGGGYFGGSSPLPPLPPSSSAWDFFNPFESYENDTFSLCLERCLRKSLNKKCL